jgi:hypothetical protein
MDQASLGSMNEPDIRRAKDKRAHVKTGGIEAAYDVPRVPHLRIQRVPIGKTIHQNANWPHEARWCEIKLIVDETETRGPLPASREQDRPRVGIRPERHLTPRP